MLKMPNKNEGIATNSQTNESSESKEIKPLYKIPKIDEYKNTKLHHAAASGEIDEVLKCLKDSDMVVDAENFMGWTPLMMSCRKGFIDIAKLLLEHKADASKKNKFGCNVFLITVASGEIDLVTIILKHLLSGGISRQSLQIHFSPLSLAVLFQRQDILDFLLTQYFNLDIVTHKTGITPLMFAAAMENCEAYLKLVNHGADTTIKNYLAHTAQDITALRNQLKLAYNRSNSPILEKLVRSPQIPIHCQPNSQVGFRYPPQIILHSPQGFFPQQVLTPHLQKTCFVFSPQPAFIALPERKSSSVSPVFDVPAPPNVTPITPMTQQVFFPPTFMPQQFYSPTMVFAENENDRMNFSQNLMSMLSPNL